MSNESYFIIYFLWETFSTRLRTDRYHGFFMKEVYCIVLIQYDSNAKKLIVNCKKRARYIPQNSQSPNTSHKMALRDHVFCKATLHLEDKQRVVNCDKRNMN